MELSKKFYINNCKVMQELYKKNIPAKKLQEVQVGNEKKPIICKFALRQSLEFTYFDKIVCDAVYTIWLFHQNNVSQKGKGFMILRPSAPIPVRKHPAFPQLPVLILKILSFSLIRHPIL